MKINPPAHHPSHPPPSYPNDADSLCPFSLLGLSIELAGWVWSAAPRRGLRSVDNTLSTIIPPWPSAGLVQLAGRLD
jgi:hypothetical protein